MIPEGIAKGDLAKIPFPKLLWKIAQTKLTGKLELQKGEVEKAIFFDQGQPVHAESNLLPETLGKMLVEDKRLAPDKEQALMVKALESQKPFADILVEQEILDPARLMEALRKNIAQKILDCFRWEKGTFSFVEEKEFLEKVVLLKMNSARLILMGVEAAYSASRIESDGFGKDGVLYRVVPKARAEGDVFQLTAKELKFLKTLKDPTGIEEEGLQKAYGFYVLGLLEPTSTNEEISLDELVGATLLATLKPVEPPKPVSEIDPENLALANEIAAQHMRLTSLNYFELLTVPETANTVEIRDRFIEFAGRYNPARFKTAELGEFQLQGEEIFLKGCKAFATLSDFDQKVKHLDKIKAERKKAQESGKKKPGEAFKISTKLLDADTQYQKGLRFLKEKNYAKAIEFFEYAIDVDSKKAMYVAHLGWATYNHHPDRNHKSTEEILRRAADMGPSDPWSIHYLGKYLMAVEKKDEGAQLLKRAAELAPKNPDIVRDARNVKK